MKHKNPNINLMLAAKIVTNSKRDYGVSNLKAALDLAAKEFIGSVLTEQTKYFDKPNALPINQVFTKDLESQDEYEACKLLLNQILELSGDTTIEVANGIKVQHLSESYGYIVILDPNKS